jgi:uncharacterized protein YebE (UPF0316 family)
MDSALFLTPGIQTWVVIPFLIALARICDVSLGTMRIICISRGYKWVAPLLGFFEILVWLLAMKQIMENLTNILYYLVYAGGFAVGTYVGMYIEEKLAIGIRSIRIITSRDASQLIGYLRSEDYGVTTVDAQGATGPVSVIFTVVNRGDIEKVVGIINRFNPNAFYTIEDITSVKEGVFPINHSLIRRDYLNLLRMRKKGK